VPLDTVADLLAAIARLPQPERARAEARVAAAMERPALACWARLGLLALELSERPAEAGRPVGLSA
jgi:hypothetical protein